MLDRISMGQVPEKHHIAMRKPDGSLYWEHCLTRVGFDGPYSILYREHKPYVAKRAPAAHGWAQPVEANTDRTLARHHYKTPELAHRGGPAIDVRTPILFNEDVEISVVFPDAPDPVYTMLGDADELLFILEGTGKLVTEFGTLSFGPLDYVCIPKGILYRLVPDDGVKQYWLSVICNGGVGLLKQWRNELGQLRMDAPYCHRDFRRPTWDGPIDEGIREAVIRRDGRWHGQVYPHNPLDVVGWDGTVYPWVFPMLKFQPRTGQVHLPPTAHGTFGARGALICSFVPRIVDFHPEAIPCPYPHSSVDCDEVLFYCSGNFTSRKGVGRGSLSFHPYGVPHGPHPGAYEASIGVKETDETAVMFDTFKPLRPTEAALLIEDQDYHDSFCD